MQQYFRIVDLDEQNSAGALGIGNIFAEYNKISEAKEIFKVLQTCETDPQIVRNATINYAHLLMNEKNYEYAINLYLALHDKFPQDSSVAFYLAKAYFRAG